MKTFTILIVDDEEGIRDYFIGAFGKKDGFRVLAAADPKTSFELIGQNFINVAFVDMELGSVRNGGVLVSKFLADYRPSCRCFLLTQHPTAYPDELFALLDPLRPQIHGALQKQEFQRTWTDIVTTMSRSWLAQPIEVVGSELVLDMLQRKKEDGANIELTQDEVDYLVSRLLGQGEGTDGITPADEIGFDLGRVEMKLLTGGRSSSAVALARPTTVTGEPGIWSVIKFSPRKDAIQEYDRYRRFVRYILSLTHRVELLGYVVADTLGAMCYSFAGKSPSTITSLDELLRKQSPGASGALKRLFPIDARFWYGMKGPPMEIGHYFASNYRLRINEIMSTINALIQDVSNQIPEFRHQGHDLVIPGGRILHPDAALGLPITHETIKTTIIHGDMNASNIMVSDDGRVIMIDYRHTGYGPRALDFAALECSMRLAMAPEEAEIPQIAACHAKEPLVWRSVWRSSAAGPEHMPYWANISVELATHARLNFEDLSESEYAITCLFWALRIFRVKTLDQMSRFRLLVWMSQLTSVLQGQSVATGGD